MDQVDSKIPCIVQALRAAASIQPPSVIPAVGSTPRAQSQPSSRCTRSQAAPDWSATDTLALIEQIAAVDTEEWSRALSSFQKWKIVSGNCAQVGISRSSNQCKRRWELLLADYIKIRRWETSIKPTNGSGSISYWRLDPLAKDKYMLPVSFNKEVYYAIDAVIKVEDSGSSRSKDVDSELLLVGPIHADVAVPCTDLDVGANNAEMESLQLNPDRILAWEIAVKLQGNAEQVQSLLGGEIGERKKAEELIKSFGVLKQNLDQFSELFKTNGFENLVI